MGRSKVSLQVEAFLNFMGDILNLQDNDAILCAILSNYIEPKTPTCYETFIIRSARQDKPFISCSFKVFGGRVGFYVVSRLRALENEDIKEMKAINKIWKTHYKYDPPIQLIEPINTIILFHLLLNEFLPVMPTEDNTIDPKKLKD